MYKNSIVYWDKYSEYWSEIDGEVDYLRNGCAKIREYNESKYLQILVKNDGTNFGLVTQTQSIPLPQPVQASTQSKEYRDIEFLLLRAWKKNLYKIFHDDQPHGICSNFDELVATAGWLVADCMELYEDFISGKVDIEEVDELASVLIDYVNPEFVHDFFTSISAPCKTDMFVYRGIDVDSVDEDLERNNNDMNVLKSFSTESINANVNGNMDFLNTKRYSVFIPKGTLIYQPILEGIIDVNEVVIPLTTVVSYMI